MHAQLGAAIPGEQTFFVAIHPHGALHSVVVCKVPDKFSHKPRALVKLCIQTAVELHLKLLTEHLGSGGVQACHSVCTVLAHHHGLVLLCLTTLFPFSVLRLFSEPMMHLMGTPAEILDDAALYLRIYFLGMIPQMLYNMGTNILRAIGDSKRPLYFLIAASLVNIALDVVFIAVFGWGVAGAALATVLSQVASAVLTLRCIVGSQGMPWHVRPEKLRLHGDVFAAICTIGVPAAAQSAMYNISNIFIQSSMNSFGTSTIAAWGVYGKIDFVFWMTINSLGIAITTFAGQNFGARQYDRVRRGVRVCLAMAAGITLFISVTFYNLAEPLFRLFSQDDAVVAVGVGMMHVLTPVYITYICIEVLAGALRGCGDVRVPTLITVFFVCGLRMLWLFVAVPIRHEVATVEMSYPITWSFTSILFSIYYFKGGWLERCERKAGYAHVDGRV